jgi:hypothetical protein
VSRSAPYASAEQGACQETVESSTGSDGVALSHAGKHFIAVTTNSRGVCDVWLKATAPTVTVTDGGYGKGSKKVSVKRGSLTKADFALPSS